MLHNGRWEESTHCIPIEQSQGADSRVNMSDGKQVSVTESDTPKNMRSSKDP